MIVLPYPAKALWPNGRAHFRTKASATKKHREWAHIATLGWHGRPATVGRIEITVHPKPRGPEPDRDNCVAAAKAYLDGIADAYRANDRDFPVPVIRFGCRLKSGGFVIEIEPLAG